MKTDPTRETVYEALLAVERDGAQSHLLLRGMRGEARDRRFAARLFSGVLERQIQLDFVLDRFSRTPASKMRPQLRVIMRMCVYQILFMDSVPDRAAVSESVELAAGKGFARLRGFVNGVARAVIRGRDRIVWPDRETEPERFISVMYSVPEDTVRVWAGRYGLDVTERICAAFLEERRICVHLRGAPDDAAQGQLISGSGFLEDAFFLEKGTDIESVPGLRSGLMWVQDLSSQIAVRAAGIMPGAAVLDLCAAPGGKTLLAAEYLLLNEMDPDAGIHVPARGPLRTPALSERSEVSVRCVRTGAGAFPGGVVYAGAGEHSFPGADASCGQEAAQMFTQGEHLRRRHLTNAEHEFSTAASKLQRERSPVETSVQLPGTDPCGTDPCGTDSRGTDLRGMVLARDLTETKTAMIRENAARCGFDNVEVRTADAAVYDPELDSRFDVVIADLPCSGYGVAGRKPEIKYKPYAETTAALAEIQRQILVNAVRYVRPGGKLLYSTCTIAEEENEDNRRWLLEKFGERGADDGVPVLREVDITELLPEPLRQIPSAKEGYVQLLPCDGPWDGFFFAVFTRYPESM